MRRGNSWLRWKMPNGNCSTPVPITAMTRRSNGESRGTRFTRALWKKSNGGQMAYAEKALYTAGNPLVYEPVTYECAYTELDRENARLMVDRAKLRGELNQVRADLKMAKLQALVCVCALGAVAVAAL